MAYMLFGFDNYYPGGGMNDHMTTFSSMEDFYPLELELHFDVYQIFDTYNGNKSNLYMSRKVDETQDIPYGEEDKLRQKYLEEFISDFINEV